MDDQRTNREGGGSLKTQLSIKRICVSVALIVIGIGVFAFAAYYFPKLDNAAILIGLYVGCSALVGAGLGNFFGRPKTGIAFFFVFEIIVFLSSIKWAHIVGIIFPTT